jgi:hypothetical protein
MSDSTATQPPTPDAAQRVISLRLALPGFAGAWSHCGGLADYIARYAASDRYDPEGLTTQLATYINELLELLTRQGFSRGELGVHVHRQGEALAVRLRLPGDPAQLSALAQLFAHLDAPDLEAAYRARLPHLTGAPHPADPLLELAAVFGVRPVLEASEGHLEITLTVAAE